MTALPLGWRCRAAVACLVVPIMVNSISFATVVRRLAQRPSKRFVRFDDEDLAGWVTTFLHRLPDPWYPTCLRRAAVLYHLLNRAGRDVRMYLGVQRPDTGEIDAHAWLVLNDEPYLEPSTTDPSQYKVIARFPEESPEDGDEREATLKPKGV